MLQRGLMPFSINALNLMLKMSQDPDGVIAFGKRLNRRLCGLRLRKIKVADRVWPYLEGGRGDSLVLLHGFGADKDRFGSFLPMMGRHYHLVVPDLPGFGEQQPIWSTSYDIISQVRRLERFIEAAGPERFHLMGISLGGYMAAYYAARNTDRVRSLCLMNSAGFSSLVSGDAIRLFQTHGQNVFLPTDGAALQLLVDFLLYRSIKLPGTFKRYWLEQALDLQTWRKKLLEDLLAGGIYLMDFLAGRIVAPTLVVWGAEDRICHVSTVDNIMALIENCQSVILHGCGHIPIFEYPSLSAKLYRDFLRSCDKGAGKL